MESQKDLGDHECFLIYDPKIHNLGGVIKHLIGPYLRRVSDITDSLERYYEDSEDHGGLRVIRFFRPPIQ